MGGPKKAFRVSRTRPLTAAAVFLTLFYYIIIFGQCKPEKRAKVVGKPHHFGQSLPFSGLDTVTRL